jgi:hypothetical protein
MDWQRATSYNERGCPANLKEPAMRPKRSHKNGATPKKWMPKWKRHTDDYRTNELARLKFASRKDSDAAIEIVWGGRLTGMPFALDPNDIDSLVVPKVSIPFFVEAGLRFTEKAY